jgi:Cys-rich repeat protein
VIQGCFHSVVGAEPCLCHPDTRPRPFCTVDSDCATGHVCRSGVCRTPCATMPTGTYCMTFDVQLTTCSMTSGEYLCYSANETSPQCGGTLPACPSGQSCVDAHCRAL